MSSALGPDAILKLIKDLYFHECESSYSKLGTKLGITRNMAKLIIQGQRRAGIKTALALGYKPVTVFVPAGLKPSPSDPHSEDLAYT